MNVAIIGAGLSGLALARHLQSSGIEYSLFEARERAGGRILSVNGKDMGATWFWPTDNAELVSLTAKLDLPIFAQWTGGHSLYQVSRRQTPQRFIDPQGYRGAYRIEGGVGQLTKALADGLELPIYFCHQLVRASKSALGVQLTLMNKEVEYRATFNQVAFCLPPRVLVEQVAFEPALDRRLMSLLQRTPTWMAGQAKALVMYKEAIWRAQDLNGSAFCHDPKAVLGEVFDASDNCCLQPALGAFISASSAFWQQQRNTLAVPIAEQLTELFGPALGDSKAMYVQDWSQEPFTSTESDLQMGRHHPHYGHPWFKLDHWQDRLFFCGSETADEYGGYMEGALQAAKRVARSISLSQGIKQCI